jgi:hypothetical protein
MRSLLLLADVFDAASWPSFFGAELDRQHRR